MGKPAARISDMHVCPMFNGNTPHVGGPIVGPGVPSVLIGGMPAAVMSDKCVCAGPPDTIVLGSTGVLIGGKPAARMGDQCAHGGKIVVGCTSVLIGEVMPVAPKGAFAIMPPKVAFDILDSLPQKAAEIMGQTISLVQAAHIGSMYSSVINKVIQVVKELTPTEEKKVEKSEIQFKLLDQSGEPVAGEKYKVKLPDGSVREGKTNDKGEVHITGIEPGNCKISFPDIDGNDWS